MLKALTHILLILLLFSSCTKEKCNCTVSKDVNKDINRLDSLINDPENRAFYNSVWDSFDEPTLIQCENETYRFSRHGSFGHTEVYRIEKNKDQYSSIVKAYNREYGKKDTLLYFVENEISEEKWMDIRTLLDDNCFWTYSSTIDRYGLDGATWMLEGYQMKKNNCTEKNYHYISRWSPKDSIFVSMCNVFQILNEE